MIPLEVLTLVLLASITVALPQPQNANPQNATASQVTDIPQPTEPFVIHDESSVKGFDESPPTGIPKSPHKVHGENTADDFQTPPPHQTRTFTRTPKIIHTEIAESGFEDPTSGPPKVIRPDPTDKSPQSWQPTGTPSNNPSPPGGINNGNPGGNSPSAPGGNPNGPAPAQPTSGDDLLHQIISRIGTPRPGAQPSNEPAAPTGENHAPNGNSPTVPGENQEQPQATGFGQEATPGSPVTTPGALPTAPALTVDQSITLGPATLTLTPGLSTTVGTGSAATFLALTTNSAGQTIIVISSSGTEVSATVTRGPQTAASVKTGVDASATAAANSGSPTGPGAAATTTSRKGGASGRWRWGAEWWLAIVAGIVGGVVVL